MRGSSACQQYGASDSMTLVDAHGIQILPDTLANIKTHGLGMSLRQVLFPAEQWRHAVPVSCRYLRPGAQDCVGGRAFSHLHVASSLPHHPHRRSVDRHALDGSHQQRQLITGLLHVTSTPVNRLPEPPAKVCKSLCAALNHCNGSCWQA